MSYRHDVGTDAMPSSGADTDRTMDSGAPVAVLDSESASQLAQRPHGMWRRFMPRSYKQQAPEARGGHTFTLVGETLILFGGHARYGKDSLYFNDTWALDNAGVSWFNYGETAMPPEPRAFHTATTVEDKVLIYGGRGGKGEAFTHLNFFDTSRGKWNRLTVTGKTPPGRFMHSASLVDTTLYVFGGTDGTRYMNDLHALDLERLTWSPVERRGEAPSPRALHTAVSLDGIFLTFGGNCPTTHSMDYFNDTHVFDPRTGAWSLLRTSGARPKPRSHHSSVLIDHEHMAVVGGWAGGKDMINRIDVLDLDSLRWTMLPNAGKPPSGRYGASVTTVNDKLFLFGGWDGVRPMSDAYAATVQLPPPVADAEV